ncbi:MAG: aspartate ammonia-lyase [Porticoccaceae bacterium]|nr:aspartate ammonia-lyase [Porticoccaceae bacterium]
MNTRIEVDSMGELEVPSEALYGAQTQRAINNFPVSGIKMPEAFIRALLLCKSAAAEANVELKVIPLEIGRAISSVAKELVEQDNFMEHFPVDIFQTGSGTSSNMNANEVLAALASNRIGEPVSPNDHVNFGQSSNDIIPTSIHVSAVLVLEQKLLPALRHLANAIEAKADSVDIYIKTGRTHLMDAMPVRMGQSVRSWGTQIKQNIELIESVRPLLITLAQGGTAVGTGINAHHRFAALFCEFLSNNTSTTFCAAENFFTHIGTQDVAVALSGKLKTVAVSIMKISNDLRWMNSGPLAGLGEIELEALQPGSSIMPGKVNPVIPESAAMVAAQVMGNDSAITIAGQSGNFELNVMLPVIAHNLLESIKLLSSVAVLLADKAIATFKVKEKQLELALSQNPILVTALNPIIGYLKAAEIAKKAYKQGRAVLDVAEEETDIDRRELEKLLDPHKLTLGGL